MAELASFLLVDAANIAAVNLTAVENLAKVLGLDWPSLYAEGCGEFGPCYKVTTAIDSCGDCSDSTDIAWGGYLNDYNDGNCDASASWQVGYWPSSVDGKLFDAGNSVLTWEAGLYYHIQLGCYDDQNSTGYIMWQGYKDDGADPAGEYDFDGADCNTGPATIDVVACSGPFATECGDWADCYRIKGYYDGLLTADAGCEDSAEDPWTGGPMPVEWAYCEDNPPQMSWTDPSNAETSLDGKRTSSTGDDGAQVYWDGDPTFGYWGLFVFCSDTSDNPIDVWNGVRYTGANPDSGPFAYVTGSASDVAELEIEPCPA